MKEISVLMSVYNQSKNIDHLTVRTRRKAAVDTENLRKYGMIQTKINPSCINNLMEIGWNDPFKDESLKKPSFNKMPKKEADSFDIINDIDFKKISCFCLPSKVIVTRMMRACIEVQRVPDLWVYSIPRHNKFIQNFESRL